MRPLKINDKVIYVGHIYDHYYKKEGTIINISLERTCPYEVLFQNGISIWCYSSSLMAKVQYYPNLF